MQLNSYCMLCQIKKQEEKIRQFDDENKKVAYMKEILRRYVDAGLRTQHFSGKLQVFH